MPKLIFLTQVYHTETVTCGKDLTIHCCETCARWHSTMLLSKWIHRSVNILDGTDPTLLCRGMNHHAVEHKWRDSHGYWRTVMNMIGKNAHRQANEAMISLKYIAKRIIRTQLGFDSEKINQLSLFSSLKDYLHSPFDRGQSMISKR